VTQRNTTRPPLGPPGCTACHVDVPVSQIQSHSDTFAVNVITPHFLSCSAVVYAEQKSSRYERVIFNTARNIGVSHLGQAACACHGAFGLVLPVQNEYKAFNNFAHLTESIQPLRSPLVTSIHFCIGVLTASRGTVTFGRGRHWRSLCALWTAKCAFGTRSPWLLARQRIQSQIQPAGGRIVQQPFGRHRGLLINTSRETQFGLSISS
jgi:hypothetical protein